MIILFFVIFIVLSLLLDYYALRKFLWRVPWVRYSFIGVSLLLNGSTLCFVLFIRSVVGDQDGRQMAMVAMWVLLVFLMGFMPRVLFLLVSVWGLIFKRFRRAFEVMGFVAGSALLGVMIYGATLGRSRLRVERVVIESSKLPRSFDGYRVAQFSDTHLGNLLESGSLIEDLVQRVNHENVDLVVFTGDLVNIQSSELTPRYLKALSSFTAKDGVYSVLGNHDYGLYIYDTAFISAQRSLCDLIKKQEQMGWRLLQNEHQWLVRGVDSVAIAGVHFPEVTHFRHMQRPLYGGSNLAGSMDGISDTTFSILLSHSPQLFDSVPMLVGPSVTMSGHVHSMQAKIELFGHQFSPAQFLYPMFSGLYKKSGRYLYINDGIGYVLYPMRVGTKPEITIYEFRKK